MDPGWDLGAEYAELVHEDVLWYSNSGFPETGYSHDGWLMGHDLGGSGEAVTVVVRARPRGWDLEPGLHVRHATWGMPRRTPGTGEMTTLALSVNKIPGGPMPEAGSPSPLLWEITAEWNREKAEPAAESSQEKTWWRIYLKVGI